MRTARFAPEPKSARAARDFVGQYLQAGDVNPEIDVGVVALLVSELATNAIVHVGRWFEVRVDLTATCVHVGVDDLSTAVPRPQRPGDTTTSGRGLSIVEAAASRWGIEATGSGKRTWFELCSGSICVDHPSTTR